MAAGTVKVNVQLVEHALAIVVAYRVLHGAGAIVDTVNEQVLMEQRDRTGDGRFIDCPQNGFQVRKAECLGYSSISLKINSLTAVGLMSLPANFCSNSFILPVYKVGLFFNMSRRIQVLHWPVCLQNSFLQTMDQAQGAVFVNLVATCSVITVLVSDLYA